MQNHELSLTGEVTSGSNYDIFGEFFQEYHSFVSDYVPPADFTIPADYSDFEIFVTKYGKGFNPINISYTQDIEYFGKLQRFLKSRNIDIVLHDDLQLISLSSEYNSRLNDKNLMFSGNILLNSSLNLESANIIAFNNAKFFIDLTVNNYYKCEISIGKSTHLYISNSVLPLISGKVNDNYWFVGEISIFDSLFIVKNTKSKFDITSDCNFNIDNQAIITVNNNFIVNNLKCLNHQGYLQAQKVDLAFRRDLSSDFFIGKNATIACTKELTTSLCENTNIINNGILVTNKLSICSIGKFHNNGAIIIGNQLADNLNHIRANAFFQYSAGFIKPNAGQKFDLEITTTTTSGNLGEIQTKDLILNSASKSNLHTTARFYNNGKLIAENIEIANKAQILNDQLGVIYASKELSIDLVSDLKHLFAAKHILNRGGNIIANDANFDASIFFSINGNVNITNLNSNLNLLGVQDGNTTIGKLNNLCSLSILIASTSNKTIFDVTGGANQAINMLNIASIQNQVNSLPAIAGMSNNSLDYNNSFN